LAGPSAAHVRRAPAPCDLATPADVAIPVGLVVLGPPAFVGASMLAEVLRFIDRLGRCA